MTSIHILREFQGYLAVEKPSGLLCQPGRGEALRDSVLQRIRSLHPGAELVHRLDRDTSGLLLVALEAQAHRALSGLFQLRMIRKTYESLCHGILEGQSGFIASPLAKYQDRPPLYRSHPEGRMALTAWTCLDRRQDYSRLALFPLTGRSHQLRVHLSELGHPIMGDPLYNPEWHLSDRLLLHATRLSFDCPISGCQVDLRSPTPF